MVKIELEQKAKCPFKPAINEKSDKMMAARKRYLAEQTDTLRDEEGEEQEVMEGCHERLYGLSMVPKREDDKFHPFHPEINKNSSEIVGMMKEGDDYA